MNQKLVLAFAARRPCRWLLAVGTIATVGSLGGLPLSLAQPSQPAPSPSPLKPTLGPKLPPSPPAIAPNVPPTSSPDLPSPPDPLETLKTEKACLKCDLRFRQLKGLDFSGTNLEEANFYGADLTGANFYGANLTRANLGAATLTGANLQQARLREANLRWSSLRGANLTAADLDKANVAFSDLRGANLSHSNFKNALIESIRATNAIWCGAILPNGTQIRQPCPEGIPNQPPQPFDSPLWESRRDRSAATSDQTPQPTRTDLPNARPPDGRSGQSR